MTREEILKLIKKEMEAYSSNYDASCRNYGKHSEPASYFEGGCDALRFILKKMEEEEEK
jgi:hypothetical protein